jgi:hypothetical protein
MNWQAIVALVGAITFVGGLVAALVKRMEGHLLEAIAGLRSDVAELRNHRDKDRERVHAIELAFAQMRADMAQAYISRGEHNRIYHETAEQIARVRTFCSKKHGEASG